MTGLNIETHWQINDNNDNSYSHFHDLKSKSEDDLKYGILYFMAQIWD